MDKKCEILATHKLMGANKKEIFACPIHKDEFVLLNKLKGLSSELTPLTKAELKTEVECSKVI